MYQYQEIEDENVTLKVMFFWNHINRKWGYSTYPMVPSGVCNATMSSLAL